MKHAEQGMPDSSFMKRSRSRRTSPALLRARSKMYSGRLIGFPYSLCASCSTHMHSLVSVISHQKACKPRPLLVRLHFKTVISFLSNSQRVLDTHSAAELQPLQDVATLHIAHISRAFVAGRSVIEGVMFED